jgi:hypothetical protein
MCRVLPPSEPPDGERPRCFRLAVVGGTQFCGSRYLSAIARLQGFSSGSPAASPCRWSPKTVTTSLMVGRSKPGYGLCLALSFKDLHHPCWGGGRAEPELYLPHGFVGHLLLQHSGEKALTGLAEGADFDNAGLVGREGRQLQRVGLAAQLALARLLVPPPAVGRSVAIQPLYGVALRAPGDRPRRRALLGQRSCSWAVLPLLRYDASAWRSVLRWWRLKKSSSPTRSPPPSALWASGSLALIACPRPSSGDVGEGLVVAASALRSSLLLFGRPERRSLSLLPERALASHLGFCRPACPPMWGVVRTCGGETGVPFVMAP